MELKHGDKFSYFGNILEVRVIRRVHVFMLIDNSKATNKLNNFYRIGYTQTISSCPHIIQHGKLIKNRKNIG